MERQSTSAGSTFSFDVEGGQSGGLRLSQPAADLQARRQSRRHGIARSAIPTTTVHSGLTEEARREIGITPSLIRMSIGIEHPDDLIADIAQAFG